VNWTVSGYDAALIATNIFIVSLSENYSVFIPLALFSPSTLCSKLFQRTTTTILSQQSHLLHSLYKNCRFHNQMLQDTVRSISIPSFCWWGVDVGQHIRIGLFRVLQSTAFRPFAPKLHDMFGSSYCDIGGSRNSDWVRVGRQRDRS
jgi:hypothetical protein